MYFYEEYNYGNQHSYDAFSLTNASYPYHFHRCYEVLSVISGHMQLKVSDQKYTLSSGDLGLIFPDQLHSFQTIGASNIVIIIFSPEMIQDFTNAYKKWLPESSIIHSYSLSLEKALLDNIYEQKALLYHICGTFTKEVHITIPNNRSDQLILLHTILTYIEEHYSSNCTLRDLARVTGYDYTYLSKYFESKMKITYTSYLNQIRIHHACTLLKESIYPISDIAFQCGYNSIRTFNRNFLDIIGKPPKEYR